jgi:hypothetical protein
MNIDQLIEVIEKDPKCNLIPPTGSPFLTHTGHCLPEDLRKFYELCGGMELFAAEEFGFRIATPKTFLPSNPLLLGESYNDAKEVYDADRSAAWYVIAFGTKLPQVIVTIDTDLKRLGYCYDSFWDVYATGNSKIVAKTFTDLIQNIYECRGLDIYWERSGFEIGNAYE